jgi:hypothetical protein
VQLALERIEAAGIMGHVRRGLVVGGRWCQWTSAYLFASPERWVSDTDSRSALVSNERNKAVEKRRGGQESALSATGAQPAGHKVGSRGCNLLAISSCRISLCTFSKTETRKEVGELIAIITLSRALDIDAADPLLEWDDRIVGCA